MNETHDKAINQGYLAVTFVNGPCCSYNNYPLATTKQQNEGKRLSTQANELNDLRPHDCEIPHVSDCATASILIGLNSCPSTGAVEYTPKVVNVIKLGGSTYSASAICCKTPPKA